jgi:hypothetical protein
LPSTLVIKPHINGAFVAHGIAFAGVSWSIHQVVALLVGDPVVYHSMLCHHLFYHRMMGIPGFLQAGVGHED